jgi:hypothetical protein
VSTRTCPGNGGPCSFGAWHVDGREEAPRRFPGAGGCAGRRSRRRSVPHDDRHDHLRIHASPSAEGRRASADLRLVGWAQPGGCLIDALIDDPAYVGIVGVAIPLFPHVLDPIANLLRLRSPRNRSADEQDSISFLESRSARHSAAIMPTARTHGGGASRCLVHAPRFRAGPIRSSDATDLRRCCVRAATTCRTDGHRLSRGGIIVETNPSQASGWTLTDESSAARRRVSIRAKARDAAG